MNDRPLSGPLHTILTKTCLRVTVGHKILRLSNLLLVVNRRTKTSLHRKYTVLSYTPNEAN